MKQHRLSPNQIETAKGLFKSGYQWTHPVPAMKDGYTLDQVKASRKQQEDAVKEIEKRIDEGNIDDATRANLTYGRNLLRFDARDTARSLSRQSFVVGGKEGTIIDRSSEIGHINDELKAANETCEALDIF